jgi:hypothetical protein
LFKGYRKAQVLLITATSLSVLLFSAYSIHCNIETLDIISPNQTFQKVDPNELLVILDDKEKVAGLIFFPIIPLLQVITFNQIPSLPLEDLSLKSKTLILRC